MNTLGKALEELPVPVKYGLYLASWSYLSYLVLFQLFRQADSTPALIAAAAALASGMFVTEAGWDFWWRFCGILLGTVFLSSLLFFAFYYTDTSIDPGTALIGSLVHFGSVTALPTVFSFFLSELARAWSRP